MTEPKPTLAQEASTSKNVKISTRVANIADLEWVADLHERAFGPGRFARAAFRVRESFPIDETLSLIAEIDGVKVSSVWMTPISLSGVQGYLLGPLATDPNFQNRGAGKKLVTQVTKLALERDLGSYVLLVGDAAYYQQLGFEPTELGAIQFPGAVDPTRILVHSADKSLAGALHGKISAF